MKIKKILLILAALFWGVSGLITQVALEYNTTMNIIALRFTIAAIFSLIIFRPKIDAQHLKNGLFLSLLLVGIYYTSTQGLKYTSASNASFIIGSNVVIVPLINKVLFKEHIPIKSVITSAMCILGLALITLNGSTPINIGDIYCLLDAVIYSFYIIFVSRIGGKLRTESLITIQYVFVAIIGLLYVYCFEGIKVNYSYENILSISALGFFCTFLAFYFQTKGQEALSPDKASQLLSLMPIFAIFLDVVCVDLLLTPSTVIGATIIILSNIRIKDPLIRLRKLVLPSVDVEMKW